MIKNFVNKNIASLRMKDQQKASGSPKGEVGEIDTRAPFQSVKAAVSLFGEVAVSKDKSVAPVKKSKLSSEDVAVVLDNFLDMETRLLISQRELDKYKNQLEKAETTKARVRSELERAKKTLEDLTANLQIADKAKKSAMEAAEAVKNQAKELDVTKSQLDIGNAARKQETEEAREQYMIIVSQLDMAKQHLTKMRQDYDATLEGKSALFQQAAEAQRLATMNKERVRELSKQIQAMRETEKQFKLASTQAQEQQAKILADKDAQIQASKTAKEGIDKKLEPLKSGHDPEMTRHLQEMLANTTSEIEVLQEEVNKMHSSEMDAVKAVTAELNEATETLQQVAQEENSLRDLVTTLRLELSNVTKEHADLQEKAAQKEALVNEKANEALEQQKLTLQQLYLEIESSVQEAEEMKRNSQELKREAESFRLIVKSAEEKLDLALSQVEEAKAADMKACNEMKFLSEKQNTQNKESANTIKISLEEFNSLKRKPSESDEMANAKVDEALVEIELLITKKNEAEKKLEANRKAIEEIKEATDMALKSAEMAEAAQRVVEGELRKWRQEEETV